MSRPTSSSPTSSSCAGSIRRSSTTSATRRRTTSWARRSTRRRTRSCSGRRPKPSRARRPSCGSSGTGCLIHDAYRPWYVTKMFWDGTPPDKHVFVADPSQGSRHNRGCAVDLTLYDLKTGAPIRMTGGYDEMTDRSYPLYPGGTSLTALAPRSAAPRDGGAGLHRLRGRVVALRLRAIGGAIRSGT